MRTSINKLYKIRDEIIKALEAYPEFQDHISVKEAIDFIEKAINELEKFETLNALKRKAAVQSVNS